MFPFTVTDLTIPEVDLNGATYFFSALRLHLLSLSVDMINAAEKTVELIVPPSHFEFPKLWNLRFRGPVRDTWVKYFLMHVSCPSLEKVKLCWLRKDRRTAVLGEHLHFNQIRASSLPNLQKMKVTKIPLTQSALSCISYLTSTSVRDLAFSDLYWTELESEKPEDRAYNLSLLRQIFKLFLPEKLEICGCSFAVTLAIIASLDISSLRHLELNHISVPSTLRNPEKCLYNHARRASMLFSVMSRSNKSTSSLLH
jgi:hypothetical protein